MFLNQFQRFSLPRLFMFSAAILTILGSVEITLISANIENKCTEALSEEPNRDEELPKIPIKEDFRLKSSSIVQAQEIIRKGLQQFLDLRDMDLGSYLNHIIETDPVFIDEYGKEIRSYYKVFSFIWIQYNETLCQNYAVRQFDKDKLDLCSVARYLSHRREVKDRETIVKRLGDALGYRCHPCTPYKRKEFGETIVPSTDNINPNGVSPDESLILCNQGNQNQLPSTTLSTTTTTEQTTTSTTTERTTTSTTTKPTTTSRKTTTVTTTFIPVTVYTTTTNNGLVLPGNIGLGIDDWSFYFTEILWTGGIVPYTISNEFDQNEREVILRGMRNIQEASCVKFIPRTSEVDYLQIISGAGCYSSIGRVKGAQVLSLEKNVCVRLDTATKMLMHSLAFQHEHNRPDRDDYIKINVANLLDGSFESDFNKFDPILYPYYFYFDYDINSILHYRGTDWARDQTIPTITSKIKGKEFVGPINGLLSQMDGLKLKQVYNCTVRQRTG